MIIKYYYLRENSLLAVCFQNVSVVSVVTERSWASSGFVDPVLCASLWLCGIPTSQRASASAMHLKHTYPVLSTSCNLEYSRASAMRSVSVFISADFNVLCFVKQFRDDKVLLLQINHGEALKASDSY